MKKLNYFALAFFIFSCSTTNSQDKKSQDTIRIYYVPSITVTSTKAVERETPVPFSEITESLIQQSYTIEDFPQFLNRMPSVLTYSQSGNGIGYTNLNMRGFDQRRISVLINGIPQNDPEDHNVYWIDFPDLAESLESVQIQRGAGLINYGAAAIGGSINLTTSNFVTRRYIKLHSGLGWQKFGAGTGATKLTMQKYLAEFSSGMIDNYAFYGRLSKVMTDGYRDRSWADLNSYFFSGARFDENLTTQLNIFGGPLSDGLVYNGLPKAYIKDEELRRKNFALFGWAYDSTGVNVAYKTDRKPQEIEEFSQPHYELLNDWKVSDEITFRSALFYYTGKGFFDFDGSWASSRDLRLTQEFGLNLDTNLLKDFDDALYTRNTIIRAWVDNRHGGWIPRVVYNHGSGELTAGAEVRIHRSEHWGNIKFSELLPMNFNSDYKFYSYEGERDIFSIFAREKYWLQSNLMLNVEAQLVHQGYRITNEKAGYINTKYINISNDTVGNGRRLFNISYLFFNPRLGFNYNVDDCNSLYSSFAFTSREPRMTNLYNASESYYGGAKPQFEGDTTGEIDRYDFSKPLVKPESMFDIELGWRYRSESAFASVNLYWMEYFDELVKSGKLNIFGDPVDGNAKRTRHFGAEFQGGYSYKLAPDMFLRLEGNATLSKNVIIDFDFITEQKAIVSLKDNPIAGFPGIIGFVSLSYKYNNFYASISAKHAGEFRTDNFGDMLTNDTRIIEHLKDSWDGYYKDNKVDSYTVFDAEFSYNFSNVFGLQAIKLHGKISNLLNTLYAAGGEGKEFFPAAERNFYLSLELLL